MLGIWSISFFCIYAIYWSQSWFHSIPGHVIYVVVIHRWGLCKLWMSLHEWLEFKSDVYEAFVNPEESFQKGLLYVQITQNLLTYLRKIHEWGPKFFSSVYVFCKSNLVKRDYRCCQGHETLCQAGKLIYSLVSPFHLKCSYL